MDLSSAAGGGVGVGGSIYPDSASSSPRSRGGESLDEPFFPGNFPAAGGGRLRFMCSFGGRIVPRPTDKSLCYLGGDTRLVSADRHAPLSEFTGRLSRSLFGGRPFLLKYQLPHEDLDALISVSNDEDFENLIDECDRLAASGSGGRIRLFLFPAKPEPTSSSSAGSLSLLDDAKTETWFVDALNCTFPRSESANVNSLLGLEDAAPSAPSPAAVAAAAAAAPPQPHRQDVQSVPDSPLLDKNSSFGSTSSGPSLPPIRVRTDERPTAVALADHLNHVVIADPPPPQQQAPAPAPVPAAAPLSVISPPHNSSNRTTFSDDDRSSDHGGWKAPPQPKAVAVDTAAADPSASRTLYYERPGPIPALADLNPPVSSDVTGSYRIPIPATDAASYPYAQLHTQPTSKPQQVPQPQMQPQFIAAGNPQYSYQTQAGQFMQMPLHQPYYAQIQQQPQQVYYVPVGQNPPQLQQYNLVDTSGPKTSAIPIPQLAVKPDQLQPGSLYHQQGTTPSTVGAAFARMGTTYHLVAHPSQQPAPAAMANYGGGAGASYDYTDQGRLQQVYYSQAAPVATALPQQYGAVGDAAPGMDGKQGRLS